MAAAWRERIAAALGAPERDEAADLHCASLLPDAALPAGVRRRRGGRGRPARERGSGIGPDADDPGRCARTAPTEVRAAAALRDAGLGGGRHPRQPAAEAREAGLTLAPLERRVVPTGLRVEIPQGFEVQIRPRSGLALQARHHAAQHAGHHRQRLSRARWACCWSTSGPSPTRSPTATGSRSWSWRPVVQARFALCREPGRDRGAGRGGFGSTGRR